MLLFFVCARVCVCLCVLGNTGTSHCLTDSISRFIESYVMGIHKSCSWSLRSSQHSEEMRQCLDFRGVCVCVCVCVVVLDITIISVTGRLSSSSFMVPKG